MISLNLLPLSSIAFMNSFFRSSSRLFIIFSSFDTSGSPCHHTASFALSQSPSLISLAHFLILTSLIPKSFHSPVYFSEAPSILLHLIETVYLYIQNEG